MDILYLCVVLLHGAQSTIKACPERVEGKRGCHSVPVSRRERFIRLVAPSLMASITREIVNGRRGQRMACQWSGRNTQAVRRNLCWARRSAITSAKAANSESERCRRRGKSRQVMKNQRSDSTRRRSRDMPVIITLGSNPTIQDSRCPAKSRRGIRQLTESSALPAEREARDGSGAANHRKPLIRTTSRVRVLRTKASCLPSRDQANWMIRFDLKPLNCFGGPPSTG
jgi:hypothetical protein